VNEQHFERAAGVATEALRKAQGAGVDRGAMVMAFLSIAINELRKSDGATELASSMRRFADCVAQQAQARPN
jgi:hypothetical protein